VTRFSTPQPVGLQLCGDGRGGRPVAQEIRGKCSENIFSWTAIRSWKRQGKDKCRKPERHLVDSFTSGMMRFKGYKRRRRSMRYTVGDNQSVFWRFWHTHVSERDSPFRRGGRTRLGQITVGEAGQIEFPAESVVPICWIVIQGGKSVIWVGDLSRQTGLISNALNVERREGPFYKTWPPGSIHWDPFFFFFPDSVQRLYYRAGTAVSGREPWPPRSRVSPRPPLTTHCTNPSSGRRCHPTALWKVRMPWGGHITSYILTHRHHPTVIRRD